MSEIQESESNFEVSCTQCQTTPDNYVKLDCDHKFCLICLAYNYLQQQQINSENEDIVKYAICSKCQYQTQLDSDTIAAIQYVIKEIILPMIEQNQEDQNSESLFDLRQSETIRQSKENFSDLTEFNQQLKNEINNKQSKLEQPDFKIEQPINSIKKTDESNIKQIELQQQQQQQQQQQSIQKLDRKLNFQDIEIEENEQYKQQQQNDLYYLSGMNERIQLYQERLDKNLKQKFQSIKDLQEQKYLFQQKCQISRDEIQNEILKQIQSLEIKKNTLINEVNLLENQQLQDISNQESEFENQIQIMAKQQEELKNLKKQPEELSKFLFEIEKNLSSPSQSLQIKSQLLSSQRSLIRIQSLAQQNEERLTSDSKLISFQQIQQTHSKLSPIKSDRINDIWSKLNESERKSKLKESAISSNQKSKWKETILEIFDKKDQSFERYSVSKQNNITRHYNIHQVLNMQQQSFQIQKENLLKR